MGDAGLTRSRFRRPATPWLAAAWLTAGAAAAAPVAGPHGTVELVARSASVQPGSTAWLGVRFSLEPGWHVYWRNPGDTGIPPALTWTLPAGYAAGEPVWPAPQRIDEPPLTSFGYRDALLLPVPVTVPSSAVAGTTVRFAVQVVWLVCKDTCIPGHADLTLAVPVRAGPPRVGAAEAAFARAERDAPAPAPAGWTVSAASLGTAFVLTIRGSGSALAGAPVFFPFVANQVDNATPQTVERRNGEVRLVLAKSDQLSGVPGNLAGVLVANGRAWTVAASLAGAAAGAGRYPWLDPALWTALLFAFLGGLILNLMPCVFPVLTIKVIGFMNQAVHHPREVRLHGLLYGFGVVVSFWALAGALIALRSGGQQLGWGFQLQSPGVILALIGLLFMISLNLLGVFETGTSLVAAIGRHAHAEGRAGALFSGVLATILATPCTAPFMGTALGYAATLPPARALLVFTALALGMALPYVVLSSVPALGRLLPRPGRWMETFKQAMAFPMLATVLWLLWVIGLQSGMAAILVALAGLLVLGLGGWIYGRWHNRAGRAAFAVAIIAAAVLGGEGLRAGRPMAPSATPGGWERYSRGRLDQLRAEGRPVFVDFTAAWCLTCKVNEAVALDVAAVREAFATRHVAMLRGDWTNPDPEIEKALAEFGRNGVPLYVLYPGGPQAAPHVLPQILTPQTVLAALAGVKAP